MMANNNAQNLWLYSGVGEQLTHYAVNIANGELHRGRTISTPDIIQYAWPHPSGYILYIALGPRSASEAHADGAGHQIAAYRVDLQTMSLLQHGEPQKLISRPIHICVDKAGEYVFTAYNDPSDISVHRINDDGTVGLPVAQSAQLDKGIFAHQVRVSPSNNRLILVTRGNNAADGKPEDPGALKLYEFDNGNLTNLASVAPNGGYGFGPRDIDFHPTQPWVYVSLERQNELQLYTMHDGGLGPTPLFRKTTLADSAEIKSRQLAGTLQVHPNGKFVYVVNRADGIVEWHGQKVFAGGENSIAVFAIDQATGEPTLIQNADPQSIYVRTFAIDPTGKLLIAASTKEMAARDGDNVTPVPAAISILEIRADGKLEFLRKYDIETGSRQQNWIGLMNPSVS